MNDSPNTHHDVDLDAIWNDLSPAIGRSLGRRRRRAAHRAITLTVTGVLVLLAGVAVAAPNGPIRNLFAPDVPAKQQILGLNQLGRPLGGKEDDSIRVAYELLDTTGNIPASEIPPVKDARVLIDHGDEFKLIGVTTKGAKGGLCWVATYDDGAVPDRHGRIPGAVDAQCMPQIIYEQPFTSTIEWTADGESIFSYGIVADGVRGITFHTTQRTVEVAVENKAFYWKSRPHELIIEMSARRPDGSMYRYKLPPGSYDPPPDPNGK